MILKLERGEIYLIKAFNLRSLQFWLLLMLSYLSGSLSIHIYLT